DIRKTPMVVVWVIEGPLGKGFRTCRRLIILAAIVEGAALAGLALRDVVSDVIAAPGSRPEQSVQSTCADGSLPFRRYVYRQDSPGRDFPGSFSRKNGEGRLTNLVGRVRGGEQHHLGLVDQLHHVAVRRHRRRDWQTCLEGLPLGAAAQGGRCRRGRR